MPSQIRHYRPAARARAWAVTSLIFGLAIAATTWTVGSIGSRASGEIVKPAPPATATAHSVSPTTNRTHSYDVTSSYEIVVDKRRPLNPRDYVPADLEKVHVPFAGKAPLLRAAAATEVEALFSAFKAETGLQMQSNSAYRSHAEQQQELARFSSSLGATEALETTASPGYSEHQTGLAIDIGAYRSTCTTRTCFASTVQAHWLAVNAWRFGFIIRYPLGEQALTGYKYEPWHIRYVGKTLSKAIHGHYPTLEAYFHLPPAPTY